MTVLFQDVRYGMRRLLKRPGFTLIAIITLGLGIGANTAIFSLVNTVLLRPLPVEQPERVVEVTPLMKGMDMGNFSYPFYVDFRDQNQVFDGLAAYRFAPMSLSRDGINERIWGYLVSGNYFDMLGVSAFRGRVFTQEEDRAPGADPVAVVSYGCWMRRFGGDPNLVGSTIEINSHHFTVVGITPEEFKGTVLIFTPEIYVPVTMARQVEPGSNWLEDRGSGVIFALGRLKQGITAEQARESLDVMAAGFATEFPQMEEVRFSVAPPGLIVPMMRNATLGFAGVLFATVGLVLLIACTNLANLLLAQAAQRRKEIAIRLSLGASRFRLVRQLITESVLLALAGGAAGWALASWAIDIVAAFKPPVDFALAIDLKIDWRVLVFTLSVSFGIGLLFGLVPALQATKPDQLWALKDAGSPGGARRSRLRSTLVVAQVSLSLVLLVAAGLMVRSLQKVRLTGPGFEVDHRLTMSVDLGLQGYDQARGREFYKQLVSRVEVLPGVRAASYISYLPLNLDFNSGGFYAEGQPFTGISDLTQVQYAAIWPRYFETMGIQLLEGRDFTIEDDKEESRVVIVNESLARRFWPGQDPVGKRISQGGPDHPFWQVIGIARDGKYFSLGEDPKPFVYFPMARDYQAAAALVVNSTQSHANTQSMISAIRSEVQRLDPHLPIYGVKTMGEHMRLSYLPLRAGAWIAGSFALLAMALAGLGVYGVMAYSVSQRTREIGIRMALGAQRRDVMRLVLRQGIVLAVLGLAVGLVGAVALTRLMSSVLYGVSATDTATFALGTILLGAVVLIACYRPVRRATKIDPIVALRCE